MRPRTADDRLITSREAKKLLCIGSTTLRKFCRQGRLHPILFTSRCMRFRLSEIQAFIDSNQAGEAE